MNNSNPEVRYQNFEQFYPFYLREHSHRTNRILHLIGVCCVFALLGLVAVGLLPKMALIAVPAVGYGFAWVGHFLIEKNRPATFTYPLMSLRGDFTMAFDMIKSRRIFFEQRKSS